MLPCAMDSVKTGHKPPWQLLGPPDAVLPPMQQVAWCRGVVDRDRSGSTARGAVTHGRLAPSTPKQDSCMGEQARPAEPGCIIPLQPPGREGTGTCSPIAVLALSYSQPQTSLHLRVSFAAL